MTESTNQLAKLVSAALASALAAGSGAYQVQARDLRSVGGGVEELVTAHATQQRILFDELAECRDRLEDR